MKTWIAWAVAAAALLHAVEEYLTGFVPWAQSHVAAVTMDRFVLVNTLFLGLCVGAALGWSAFFRLVIAGVVLTNAFVHLVPTVFLAEYAPGVWTAGLLYLPLGGLAFRSARRDGGFSYGRMALAWAGGALIMALPFLTQLVLVR
jgi:hypothetical protein